MRKCHSKWSENGKSSVGGLLSREEEKEEEEKSDFNPKFKKTQKKNLKKKEKKTEKKEKTYLILPFYQFYF